MADALAAAEDGRGSLILVAGEAGIGKTRLAEEAATQAMRRGALVLWGRAGDTAAAPPFLPWLQAIRMSVATLNPSEQQAQLAAAAPLAQLLPELRELLPPGTSPPASTDEEGTRARVFEAVVTILRQVAQREPVLVILDDLHEMDVSSVLLLRHVAGQLAGSRVVVLGTYRSDELKAGTVGRAVVREVLRQPHAREVLVGGLRGSDVESYIRRSTGAPPSTALVGRLIDETDGNALFITELVRHLDLEGRLVAKSGSNDRLVLPETVREVIQQRVGGLPPACQELLRTASVLGREVDLSVLQKMTDHSPDELLEHLEEALQVGVLAQSDAPHVYRFGHGLIRDVIHDGLPSRSRLDLHRRAADVLEASAGALVDERASEIAHHLLSAGTLAEPSRVVRFAELGGEHAFARLAYEEAARLFAAALAVLDRSPDDRRRVELLLRLGDASARSGEAAAAKDQFFQAAALARRLGLPEQLARAALGYGGRFVWEASRGDPHLTTLLSDALAEMEGRRDALHARLLARLAAGPLRDDADRFRRDELSAEAVEIAERLVICQPWPTCSTAATPPSGALMRWKSGCVSRAG